MPEHQPSKSGVPQRATLDDTSASVALAGAGFAEFWDAAPESPSREEPSRPSDRLEAFDALDIEDLSAEWLARATEAPPVDDFSAIDADDPAEIAADSVSMISDASRQAALFEPEEEEGADDGDGDGLGRRG